MDSQWQNQLNGTCYLFDSHSRDERGLSVDGKYVLLQFFNLSEHEAYREVLDPRKFMSAKYFKIGHLRKFISPKIPKQVSAKFLLPWKKTRQCAWYMIKKPLILSQNMLINVMLTEKKYV